MPVEKFNQTKENFNDLIALIESCWVKFYHEDYLDAHAADRATGCKIGRSESYIRTIRLGKYMSDK